jgi:hypothetical protein
LGSLVVLPLGILILGIDFAQVFLVGVYLLKMILLEILKFLLALLLDQGVVQDAVPFLVKIEAFCSHLGLFQ